MRGHASLACLLLAVGCTRVVPREAVEAPGEHALDLRPAVLERSAPVQPEWADGSMRRALGQVGFVGQASAPDLDTAKELAARELYASIASFVSVDVVSDFDDRSSARTDGTTTTEGHEVSSRVATRSEASITNVAADALYWERISTSPLAAGASSYTVWQHAWVPSAEIVRARTKKQAARASSSGRATVAVLPFRTGASAERPSALVAAGIREELGRALGRARALSISDPDVVRAIVADPTLSETEAIERVADALLPDWIAAGETDVDRDQVHLSLALYDGRTGLVRGTTEHVAAREALPELGPWAARWAAREIARATRGAEVGLARSAANGPAQSKRELEAFEAYHESASLAAEGELAKATEKIRRAIELRPKHAPSYLRLGRILEKMGRFGRITQLGSAVAASIPPLDWCTDEGRLAETRARNAIAARLERITRSSGSAEVWWTDETLLVEDALSRAGMLFVSGGARARAPLAMPFGPLPSVLRGAAESYLQAAYLAAVEGELPVLFESVLALVDLGARTDRLPLAAHLATLLLSRAMEVGDLGAQALAYHSLGVIARKAGDLASARMYLQSALSIRSMLAEKPYLLEIYNELGGLSFDEGNLPAALGWHRAAEQLAEQLQNEYLRAVLANNIGVVELALGRAASAEEKFQKSAAFLLEVQESEGRVSSGLNLARVTALRGDPEGALQMMSEARRVLERTTQEGRFAELEAERGVVEAERGHLDAALEALATASLLHRGLGRTAELQRDDASLLAAEYLVLARSASGPSRASGFSCLNRRSFELSAPVFDPPPSEGQSSLVPEAFHRLPLRELVLAANAATLRALSDYQAPHPVIVGYEEVLTIATDRERPWRPDRPRPDARRPTSKSSEVERELPVPLATVPGVAHGTEAGETKRPTEPAVERVSKTVTYERILGAFVVAPDLVLLLDPDTVDDHATRSRAETALRVLGRVEDELRRRGEARLLAAVLLDRAALEWATWSPEHAHAAASEAKELFAALGDVRGLAHVHEWLGTFLELSGARVRAGEHLALAHRLFTLLGDEPAKQRLLRGR